VTREGGAKHAVDPQPDPGPPIAGASPTGSSQATIGQEAVRSFAWAILADGGSQLIAFSSTLILARLLAPRAFGVVAACLVLISYLQLGFDLGVTSALVYEQEEGVTSRAHTAFFLNLLMSGTLATIGIVAAPVAARFFGVPGEAAIFRVFALAVFIRGCGQIQDAILRRDLLFKRRMAVDVTRALTRASVAIGLALAGYGAWALALGFLCGEVIATALSWSLVRFRPRLSFDRATAATLLAFGLPVVGIRVLAELGQNGDYLAVGSRLGAVPLAYYTMAFRMPELLIQTVLWVFSRVAFPVYSKSRALGAQALKHAAHRALTFTSLFGFPVAAGLALLSRDLVLTLLSSKWQPAIAPMTLIAIALGLASVGYSSGDLFPAVGKPGALLKVNTCSTTVGLVAFFVAAPYGITTVAWVHVVVFFIYAVVRLAIANRLVGSTFRENLSAMRPGLCVTAGLVLFALPVRLGTAPGLASLLGIALAGTAGAAAGLAIGGRLVIAEFGDLAHQAFRRTRA
jgi:lipopolysaccharide exporter